MSRIKINTELVFSTSQKINALNIQLKDDFENVETALKSLDGSWNSPASSSVIESFYRLKNSYHNERYKVLNNYANFLNNQVKEGYENTETVNISLADSLESAFK